MRIVKFFSRELEYVQNANLHMHKKGARFACGKMATIHAAAFPFVALALLVDALGRLALAGLSLLAVGLTLGQWDKPKEAFCRHTLHLWNDLYTLVAYPVFTLSVVLGAIINPDIVSVSATLLAFPIIDTSEL